MKQVCVVFLLPRVNQSGANMKRSIDEKKRNTPSCSRALEVGHIEIDLQSCMERGQKAIVRSSKARESGSWHAVHRHRSALRMHLWNRRGRPI